MSELVVGVVAFVIGWAGRGAVDRMVLSIAIRVLASAVGQDKMADGLKLWTDRQAR